MSDLSLLSCGSLRGWDDLRNGLLRSHVVSKAVCSSGGNWILKEFLFLGK